MNRVLQIVYPNNLVITYQNNIQVDNNLLVKTLNIKEWEYGRTEAINARRPYLCYIRSDNWYFIVLPNGTQITSHNPSQEILNLI